MQRNLAACKYEGLLCRGNLLIVISGLNTFSFWSSRRTVLEALGGCGTELSFQMVKLRHVNRNYTGSPESHVRLCSDYWM